MCLCLGVGEAAAVGVIATLLAFGRKIWKRYAAWRTARTTS